MLKMKSLDNILFLVKLFPHKIASYSPGRISLLPNFVLDNLIRPIITV